MLRRVADGRPNVEFQEDVVLHKCYRNPREILVTAHALGFGLYGPKVVQMLESKEHWEDIGYEVLEGDFTANKRIVIKRPKENSLEIISDQSDFIEIVQCHAVEDLTKEVTHVAQSIMRDIKEGLEPDDILVVSVDDRNAKEYLPGVERELAKLKIQCNNLHSDAYGIRDFTKAGRVTLATVHKAKGNEAFMVYVVGVNALMVHPDVRRRNMLFTAMTRAKGWVRLSGVKERAQQCFDEVESAKKHFPCLVFKYPPPGHLKRMKRDLAESADKRMRARRILDQLRQDYSDADITEMLREGPETESPRTSRKDKRKG